MARFTIPRLVGKTNAGGLTSWYWQPSATLRGKGWQPQRLGSSIGPDAPEDVAAAARALNLKVDGSAELRPGELRRVQQPLTYGAAIRRWRDAGFPSVKRPGTAVEDATARQYRSKCRTLEAWGGDVLLSSITRERVARLRDGLMVAALDGRWKGQVRHHAAHETLRVGRTHFTWLEQQGLVPRGTNPFAAFALAAPAPRDAIWWQPHRDALVAVAVDVDASMELAIDLAFSIGQREADLLRLQLGQYAEIPRYKMDPEVWEQLAEPTDAFDGRRCVAGIRLRQGKGKVWVEVPVVGTTRRRIEAQIERARAAGVTCLLFDDDSKLPWTHPNPEAGQRRFIRRFGEVRQWAIDIARNEGDDQFAAEIEALQFRDFRRTAVVFQGELGIADQLIAAITGHTLDDTKRILETYMPRTTGMAARAIALSQARGAKTEKQEQAQ